MDDRDAGARPRAGPRRLGLTFVTKANCPLCDKARDVLDAAAGEAGVAWTEADILADEALFEAYRHKVPVLRARGADVLYGRFPRRAVRRVLGLSPPVRVLCAGVEGAAEALAAAGVEAVGAWEEKPRLAVLAEREAPRFAPAAGVPVVLVGDRAAAGPGVVAALPAPLYVPDLVALIEILLA